MSYLSILLCFAEHDNSLAIEFPHHPPELVHSGLQGTLCGYVSILPLVTLINGSGWITTNIPVYVP